MFRGLIFFFLFSSLTYKDVILMYSCKIVNFDDVKSSFVDKSLTLELLFISNHSIYRRKNPIKSQDVNLIYKDSNLDEFL